MEKYQKTELKSVFRMHNHEVTTPFARCFHLPVYTFKLTPCGSYSHIRLISFSYLSHNSPVFCTFKMRIDLNTTSTIFNDCGTIIVDTNKKKEKHTNVHTHTKTRANEIREINESRRVSFSVVSFNLIKSRFCLSSKWWIRCSGFDLNFGNSLATT